MKNIASLIRFGKTSVAIAAMLCVLPAPAALAAEESFASMVRKFTLLPASEPESEMLVKAKVAVNYIQRMELPQANLAVNEALQLAPRNSYLHFLNGFVYHLQARQGDSQKNEMAIEGYQQALRIDPGNWIAQEFLGLAYLDHKKFDEAKAQFSEVLLMTPESTVSIYGLMVTAYLTGDAVTACAMADQFKKTSTEPHAGFSRSSVSVYASCNDFEKAEVMREAFSTFSGDKADAGRVERRLEQWKSFYRKREQPDRPAETSSLAGFVRMNLGTAKMDPNSLQLTQAFAVPSIKVPAAANVKAATATAQPTPASTSTSAPAAAESTIARSEKPDNIVDSASDGSPRMVLVDVVLVSTQELVSISKGINLLNALTLQLGSVGGNVAAYSRVNSSNSVSNAATAISTAITRAVTVPALSYSLNIANANNSVNEILARPTLAAMEGLPSEFFSGTNLSAGVVSTSTQGGTTVVPLDKRFGIKLAVTPTFLSNGRVQLKVEAQRTSLNTTADNPKVAYQIEIAEITANANVVMNLGDTLVLSGLSEKSSASVRDGVPVLQEVPLLQYLFSNKKSNDIQRSVLILITPRAPSYTAQAEVSQGTAMTDNIKALREKFGFSTVSTANVDAVLGQLNKKVLFREFRQGDVSIDRWDRMYSTGDRLRQALDFLYY
jgi:pilus assembly protein CpaC